MLKLHQPDAVIISGGMSQLVSFPLTYAKQSGAKLYLLHGEDPYQSATLFEKTHAAIFDAIIVNDPTHIRGWSAFGAKQVVALPYSGIDPTIYKSASTPKTIPLIFIGTLLKDRQEMLAKISHLKPHIYGYLPPGLSLHPKLKSLYRGEAWGEKMIGLLQAAKIAINFSPPHMPVGGNLRLFEIPGCGAMQITNHCPKEWFKPDKEIIVYQSDRDFIQKIKYYISHPKHAQRIAVAGQAKAHRSYTYRQRFNTILSL